MVTFTRRLDKALRIAAWAHEQADEHRKGSDIPYIMHPYSVMLIASNVTDDEDILIACLLHDILEDVDQDIYSESTMRQDFGDRVAAIVNDVTHDRSVSDWHERSKRYLEHLENDACHEAVIVSACDKLHNLFSTVEDMDTEGPTFWNRFTTKSSSDQLWWYSAVLAVISRRHAPPVLIRQMNTLLDDLRAKLSVTPPVSS